MRKKKNRLETRPGESGVENVTNSDELEEEYEEEESEIDIDDNLEDIRDPEKENSASENINFSQDHITRIPVVQ